MTDRECVKLFRVLVMHRPLHVGTHTLEEATAMSDAATNVMAKRLFMVPLPEGHHMELSALIKGELEIGGE